MIQGSGWLRSAQRVRMVALAAVAALALMVSVTVPAQAASDNALPVELSGKVVSGEGFKAGATVKIKFTAKNQSKKTVRLPKNAALLLTMARDYEGPQQTVSGGFVVDAFGDGGTYVYWDYVRTLPASLKPGQSFSTTVTYKPNHNDVANGGVFATLGYLELTENYWEKSYPFLAVTVPAHGNSDPKITGSATVGKKLTAVPGYTGHWNSRYTYQWLRDGKTIKGATKKTYTLKAADAGKKVEVRITGRLGDSRVTFVATTPKKVASLKLKSATPRITGTAKVGKTLKAKTSGWTKATKKSYQWYANGKKIKGATKSSLKLKKAHAGKRITVKVTGKKAGYKTVVKTSKKTVKVKR